MHWQECVLVHACMCENQHLSHKITSSRAISQEWGNVYTATLLSLYTQISSNLISHVDVLLICHRWNGLLTCWGIAPPDKCLLSHKHLHNADAEFWPLGSQMSFEQVNNEHSLSFTTNKRGEGRSRTSSHLGSFDEWKILKDLTVFLLFSPNWWFYWPFQFWSMGCVTCRTNLLENRSNNKSADQIEQRFKTNAQLKRDSLWF